MKERKKRIKKGKKIIEKNNRRGGFDRGNIKKSEDERREREIRVIMTERK